MRNEATRCLKPPKVTPFAKLAIGTAIRPSRDRRRTENSPLDPQSETGTLATHSGKTALWQIMIQSVWEMTNLNLPCTESLPTASSGFPRLSFILNCVSRAMSCNARLCECLSVPLYVSMVMQCKAIQCNIRRPLPLPLQGEASETAKHQQRPVLLHWQAVQELTAPRPAALRRQDLSRSAMLFRCGKTYVFEHFGW